jgi:hypothetical protein
VTFAKYCFAILIYISNYHTSCKNLLISFMEGRTDGSVTISLRNFVGEGITNLPEMTNRQKKIFVRQSFALEGDITAEGVISI